MLLYLFNENMALESKGINATDDIKLAPIFDHRYIIVIENFWYNNGYTRKPMK